MLTSKSQLLKTQMRILEFANVLFTIIWMMTRSTLLSQELKTLEYHKAFSLRDISYHIHTINLNITIGRISIYLQISTYTNVFSE